MKAEYDTEYGLVSVSKLKSISGKVVTLTLVKPENTGNGWGVSRTMRLDGEIYQKVADDFAKVASKFV